jgi:hypothetical protein
LIAGSWRGGERAVMFQNLVVVKKRTAARAHCRVQ